MTKVHDPHDFITQQHNRMVQRHLPRTRPLLKRSVSDVVASNIRTVYPTDAVGTIQYHLSDVGRYGVVEMTPGKYQLDRPLFMPGGVTLQGQYGPDNTVLVGKAGEIFPSVIHTPPENQSVPIVNGEFVMDGTMSYYINVSADCHFAINLSNVAPWKLEFDLTMDGPLNMGDACTVMGSVGMEGMDWTATARFAFIIYTYQDHVWFMWNWDGQRHMIWANHVLTPGVKQHHVYEFTGTEAKVTIDGVLAGSEPSGPIQQAYHEDVCIGTLPVRWPDSSAAAPMVKGKISNVYMTGPTYLGTPSTVHLLFDQWYGPMVPLEVGLGTNSSALGKYWTTFRGSGGEQNGVTLKNFSTSGGSGIYLQSAVNSELRNITLTNGINGFHLRDNSYSSVMSDLLVEGGRIGCVWGTACSLCTLQGFKAYNITAGMVVGDGGGVIRDTRIYGGVMKVAGMFKGDWPNVELNNFNFGDEGQPDPPAHGILASGMRVLTIANLTAGNLAHAVPLLTLLQSQGVTIIGFQAGCQVSTPGLIKLIRTPGPILDTETPFVQGIAHVIPGTENVPLYVP